MLSSHVADALKDVNWNDFYLSPKIRPYLFGFLGGSLGVLLIKNVLVRYGIPRKTAKFIIDFIDAIKSIFGS